MPQTLKNSRMTQTNLEIAGSARFFSSLLEGHFGIPKETYDRRVGYGLSIMSVGQSGRIHCRDDHPFLRPQESGQPRRLGILEAIGLFGLWSLSVYHLGTRKGLAYITHGNS